MHTCPLHRNIRLVGDPVDVVSGANTDTTCDFELSGSIPLYWNRYYNSNHNAWQRPLGWGHTHEYDRRLQFDLDGLRYTAPAGSETPFPPLEEDGDNAASGGLVLIRDSARTYRLRGNGPLMEFEFGAESTPAPLTRLVQGNHSVAFRYDTEGRLESILDSDGRLLWVSHDQRGRIVAVVLANPRAEQQKPLVRYRYDEGGNLVEGTDVYGHAFHFSYDPDNRMVSRKDRRGYSFVFRYDGRGRCAYTSGEDGLYRASLSYEPIVRKTTVTRGNGGRWEYHYDDRSNLTLVIDPYGGTLRFKYDEDGRLTEEVDPLGNATRILYDANGAPIGKQGPLGQFSTDMNAFGALKPPPHRIGSCPAEWEYGDLVPWREAALPAADSPILRQLPAPARDAVRLRRESVPPDGSSPAGRDSPEPARYDHAEVRNAFGLLVKQVDADGNVRRWAYDPNRNVRRYIDYDGSHTTFEYTSWNFRCRENDPLGHTVIYEPTAQWDIAAVVDGGGARSEYVYDLKDRLTKVIRHGVVKEEYRYDQADNLIEKLDGAGRTLLTFAIGKANLKTRRRLASGETHSFEYDDDGRYIRAACDDISVTFAYDNVGNRTADLRNGQGVSHIFEGRALVQSTILGRFTTRYAMREDGAVIIIDPTGGQHQVRVLQAGLVRRTMSNGVSEVAQYDSEGRCLVKWLSGPAGTSARQYRYYPEGDLLAVEDSQNGTTRYSYDAAHRLTARTTPGGDLQPFRYDAADNLLEKPGLSGVTLREGNRLATATGEHFDYNHRNCISERQSDRGDWRFSYDSRDMLTRIEMPDGDWEARYDPLGRRTRKSFRGQWIDYYWDTDRLAAEVFSDGRIRVYVYPDAFAVVPLLFIDYRDAETEAASGEAFFPVYDQIGAPVLVMDHAGHMVWQADLEPYGTAEVRVGTSFHMPLRFPGHYWDAESGLHYNRFRYYSPELGRYIQSDPLGIAGGINLHGYVRNPLVEVDVRGLAGGGGCEGDDDGDQPRRRDGNEDGPDLEGTRRESEPLPDARQLAEDRAWELALVHDPDVDPPLPTMTSVAVNRRTGEVHHGDSGEFQDLREPLNRRVNEIRNGETGAPLQPHLGGHSHEEWDPANCAEVNSANRALAADPGATMEDLDVHTVRVGESGGDNTTGTAAHRCRNCQHTTQGANVSSDGRS